MNSGSPLKPQAPVHSGFRRPIKEALADNEVSQKRLDILNQHPLYSNRRFGIDSLSQDELNQLLQPQPHRCHKIQKMMDQHNEKLEA